MQLNIMAYSEYLKREGGKRQVSVIHPFYYAKFSNDSPIDNYLESSYLWLRDISLNY